MLTFVISKTIHTRTLHATYMFANEIQEVNVQPHFKNFNLGVFFLQNSTDRPMLRVIPVKRVDFVIILGGRSGSHLLRIEFKVQLFK